MHSHVAVVSTSIFEKMEFPLSWHALGEFGPSVPCPCVVGVSRPTLKKSPAGAANSAPWWLPNSPLPKPHHSLGSENGACSGAASEERIGKGAARELQPNTTVHAVHFTGVICKFERQLRLSQLLRGPLRGHVSATALPAPHPEPSGWLNFAARRPEWPLAIMATCPQRTPACT